MDSLYIMTPYIKGLYLFLDSFEWFCLQIGHHTKYFSSIIQGIVIKDY